MKAIVFIAFWIVFGLFTARGQEDIGPMLDAWKTTDKSQSWKAQKIYDGLMLKKDKANFEKILARLDQYFENNHDTRLQVRAMMYRAFGERMFNNGPKPSMAELMLKAIKMAYPLKDDQLNADLYVMYAENTNIWHNYLIYNIKALELQKKIGLPHFPYLYLRLQSISVTFYRAADYKNCVRYGNEYFTYGPKVPRDSTTITDRLQMDIMGAAYKKLGNYDSCYYYYKKILDELQPNYFLWEGIAKGNLGYALTMKKNYGEAKPLLNEYLLSSEKARDSLNITIAQNNLGAYYAATKNYPAALKARYEALHIGERKANAMQHVNEALKGLADLYTATGHSDSAYHYFKRYTIYNQILQDSLQKFRFANINSQLEFDKLQNSLQTTENTLTRLRTLRNFVIGSTILAGLVVLLLFNRKILRDRNQLLALQHQQEAAQKEINYAKIQLTAFTKSIQEKNSIIEALHGQREASGDKLPAHLLQYTLLTNEQWEAFRKEFEKAYPAFFITLNQKLKHNTPASERLAALILLKLSNTEIAGALGIGRESVARNKRRLRENLGLGEQQHLEEFIATLS